MQSDVQKALAGIQEHVNTLRKNKIPYQFSAKLGEDNYFLGTKYCLEYIESKENELDEVSKKDIGYMCDPDLVNAEAEVGHELMMAPLSLANHREIFQYARKIIVNDKKMRMPNTNDKQIKYGHPEWEPSFWPGDLLVWRDNTTNFSNLKIDDFPGECSILDVLREAIKRALEPKNVDPETHFDRNVFTKEIEMRRKGNRGVLKAPHVVVDVEVLVEVEEQDDELVDIAEKMIDNAVQLPEDDDAVTPAERPQTPVIETNLPIFLQEMEPRIDDQEFRRSTRISIKTKKKEEMEEVLKLLERPTASQARRKEEKEKAIERKRKREQMEHDLYIASIEKATEDGRQQNLRYKERASKLNEMHKKLKEALSPENITEIVHDNIEHIQKINFGLERTWRYQEYYKGEKNINLNFKVIGAPFTEEQQEAVYEVAKNFWLKEKQMDRFFDVVILPEIFIRIYQVFFNVSKSEAEANITSYSGDFSEADDTL